MAKSNLLHTAPPIDVEAALTRLGANLKSARLRRNLTVTQIAEKIGTGQRAVADAERGKPTTAIATCAMVNHRITWMPPRAYSWRS